MKQKFVFILFLLFLLFISSTEIFASDDDIRIAKLVKFLEKHNSRLSPYAKFIIETSDVYEIPWTLIPAIAGVESTFCRYIPYNSHNCWGWNNGKTKFSDYQTAIDTVSKSLKTYYLDKGLNTPELIGRKYAPPTPSWGKKVRKFMNQIEQAPISPLLAIKSSF